MGEKAITNVCVNGFLPMAGRHNITGVSVLLAFVKQSDLLPTLRRLAEQGCFHLQSEDHPKAA